MVMGASRWATTLRAAARQVGCATRQQSSTAAQPLASARDKMSAWQIHSYGDLGELQLSPQIRIPHIAHPNQVLVKVEAASVNPIDVAMIGERCNYHIRIYYILKYWQYDQHHYLL